MSYDQFVHLLKDQVQIAALTFMSLLYILKVWQLMKLKPIVDLAPGRGDPNAGMRFSMMTVAMPWEMESYRKKPMKYIEFAVFHLGIAAAILATFLIPYWPKVMLIPAIKFPALIFILLGLLCGVSRLVKRISSPVMRTISVPDDYFSIILLNCYLLFAALAIPVAETNGWQIVVFFLLTTFFLIYVPFSKISHYLLWPFSRYYIGKHFGKRGVYPKNPAGLRAGS